MQVEIKTQLIDGGGNPYPNETVTFYPIPTYGKKTQLLAKPQKTTTDDQGNLSVTLWANEHPYKSSIYAVRTPNCYDEFYIQLPSKDIPGTLELSDLRTSVELGCQVPNVQDLIAQVIDDRVDGGSFSADALKGYATEKYVNDEVKKFQQLLNDLPANSGKVELDEKTIREVIEEQIKKDKVFVEPKDPNHQLTNFLKLDKGKNKLFITKDPEDEPVNKDFGHITLPKESIPNIEASDLPDKIPYSKIDGVPNFLEQVTVNDLPGIPVSKISDFPSLFTFSQLIDPNSGLNGKIAKEYLPSEALQAGGSSLTQDQIDALNEISSSSFIQLSDLTSPTSAPSNPIDSRFIPDKYLLLDNYPNGAAKLDTDGKINYSTIKDPPAIPSTDGFIKLEKLTSQNDTAPVQKIDSSWIPELDYVKTDKVAPYSEKINPSLLPIIGEKKPVEGGMIDSSWIPDLDYIKVQAEGEPYEGYIPPSLLPFFKEREDKNEGTQINSDWIPKLGYLETIPDSYVQVEADGANKDKISPSLIPDLDYVKVGSDLSYPNKIDPSLIYVDSYLVLKNDKLSVINPLLPKNAPALVGTNGLLPKGLIPDSYVEVGTDNRYPAKIAPDLIPEEYLTKTEAETTYAKLIGENRLVMKTIIDPAVDRINDSYHNSLIQVNTGNIAIPLPSNLTPGTFFVLVNMTDDPFTVNSANLFPNTPQIPGGKGEQVTLTTDGTNWFIIGDGIKPNQD